MSEQNKIIKLKSSSIRLQRNLLFVSTTLLLMVNVPLAQKALSTEKMIVMVPTLDKEISIGVNYVSEDYLLMRAEQIIQLIFNIREDSYSYHQQQLLKQVASNDLQEFKSQIEEFVSDVKQKKYYYVFSKRSHKIDNQNLNVTFNGTLDTYLGDKKISSSDKSFQVEFSNNNGNVTLISFAEIQNVKESEDAKIN